MDGILYSAKPGAGQACQARGGKQILPILREDKPGAGSPDRDVPGLNAVCSLAAFS
jgi:hypothetical protein